MLPLKFVFRVKLYVSLINSRPSNMNHWDTIMVSIQKSWLWEHLFSSRSYYFQLYNNILYILSILVINYYYFSKMISEQLSYFGAASRIMSKSGELIVPFSRLLLTELSNRIELSVFVIVLVCGSRWEELLIASQEPQFIVNLSETQPIRYRKLAKLVRIRKEDATVKTTLPCWDVAS